ncbi:hypothetical protein [Cohnella sp. REN36]|uniref:hypothetical protein n=1 Tax=Cohnella sp. REN36 TaxID=2887347 RepID=UPI001D14BFEF|nr:hypothetical protein [Cohnella sp. REN36]MCC3377599.1 hypothetical protein [Cohnella sp. REN36]
MKSMKNATKARVMAASTLVLMLTVGGSAWANGAHASTSSSSFQAEQWRLAASVLAASGKKADLQASWIVRAGKPGQEAQAEDSVSGRDGGSEEQGE